MALVLEYSPKVEARIRMKVTIQGQEVADYLLALTENDQADFEDSVAGIR